MLDSKAKLRFFPYSINCQGRQKINRKNHNFPEAKISHCQRYIYIYRQFSLPGSKAKISYCRGYIYTKSPEFPQIYNYRKSKEKFTIFQAGILQLLFSSLTLDSVMSCSNKFTTFPIPKPISLSKFNFASCPKHS